MNASAAFLTLSHKNDTQIFSRLIEPHGGWDRRIKSENDGKIVRVIEVGYYRL